MTRPIRILIAAHVACDLISVAVSTTPWRVFGPAVVAFVALLSSQVCLLGIWAALGTTRWPRRLAGVLLGLGIVVGVSVAAESHWRSDLGSFLLLVGITGAAAGAVALFLLVLRAWSLRVARLEAGATVDVAEGLQFTIRDLLILTTVVAILLSLGKIIRWLGPGFSGLHIPLPELGVMILGVVSVALLTLWTGLGLGSPARRLFVLLPFCVATGLFIPYFQGYSPWWRYVVWVSVTVGEAMLVVVSLWVVRVEGYRLIRSNRHCTDKKTNPL